VLRLRRYERILVRNRRFRFNGGQLTQNFRYRRGRSYQPFLFRKTRLNDLSYGIKIWKDFSSVLSQSTRLTDGQTDRQTEFSSLDRDCIPCSAVKMWQPTTYIPEVYVKTGYCQTHAMLHILNDTNNEAFLCTRYVMFFHAVVVHTKRAPPMTVTLARS